MISTTANMSKLQIRACILEAIDSLSTTLNNEQAIESVFQSLDIIKDKNLIGNILLKEYICENDDQRKTIIVLLLLKLVEVDLLEKNLWHYLNRLDVKDEKKSDLMDILNIINRRANFNDYDKVFQDPERMLDLDTKKMVQEAIFNPQIQVDFLDFFFSLSREEKLLLISTISENDNRDAVGNILSKLIYVERDHFVLKSLIENIVCTNSSFAIGALNFICGNFCSLEINHLCESSLKLLETRGIDEKSSHKLLCCRLFKSKILPALVTLPDGQGNIAIFVARQNNVDHKVSMFSCVVNDTEGVIACFGFNFIEISEYKQIISKQADKERKYEVNVNFLKQLLIHYENITKNSQNILPYEYVCWKYLLDDINKKENYDIKKYLESNLKKKPVKDFEFNTLLNLPFFQTWFLDSQTYPSFGEFIKELYYKFCRDTENFDIVVELECGYKKIFDKKMEQKLKNRLLLSAFLLKSEDIEIGNGVYSIIYEREYFKLLCVHILKRSIVNYIEDLIILCNSKKVKFSRVFFEKKKKEVYEEESLKLLLRKVLGKKK